MIFKDHLNFKILLENEYGNKECQSVNMTNNVIALKSQFWLRMEVNPYMGITIKYSKETKGRFSALHIRNMGVQYLVNT